jgi:hypothetical protein
MAEPTIEAYIAKHEDWRGEAMRALDALVRATVPGVRASIKWAQPVYEAGGPMVFMKAAKKHVTFGFWRGADMADPAGLLEGDGDRMRHVKIRSVALPDLAPYVAEALRLNADKGDPTKAR